MMNITISIDDETYRRVHARAAALNTSVSDMVEKLLTEITIDSDEFARLEKQEDEVRRGMVGFSGSDRLSRDELYDRKRTE